MDKIKNVTEDVYPVLDYFMYGSWFLLIIWAITIILLLRLK